MRLIEFTQSKESLPPVHINPDFVVSVYPYRGSVAIVTAASLNGGQALTYFVKDDIETVCSKLTT